MCGAQQKTASSSVHHFLPSEWGRHEIVGVRGFLFVCLFVFYSMLLYWICVYCTVSIYLSADGVDSSLWILSAIPSHSSECSGSGSISGHCNPTPSAKDRNHWGCFRNILGSPDSVQEWQWYWLCRWSRGYHWLHLASVPILLSATPHQLCCCSRMDNTSTKVSDS